MSSTPSAVTFRLYLESTNGQLSIILKAFVRCLEVSRQGGTALQDAAHGRPTNVDTSFLKG